MFEKIKNNRWLLPLKTFGIKKERAYFLENLAMLTSSGMGIFQALDSIKPDLQTRRM
jgi:type II secretory pathway component PulF